MRFRICSIVALLFAISACSGEAAAQSMKSKLRIGNGRINYKVHQCSGAFLGQVLNVVQHELDRADSTSDESDTKDTADSSGMLTAQRDVSPDRDLAATREKIRAMTTKLEIPYEASYRGPDAPASNPTEGQKSEKSIDATIPLPDNYKDLQPTGKPDVEPNP